MRIDRSLNSLQDGRKFDKCFLVEEANRQIGWSIWKNRSSRSPDIEDDGWHNDSKSMDNGEIQAPNHKNEKKRLSHSIQKNSSQASKAENGKKMEAGYKSIRPTDDQSNADMSEVEVVVMLKLIQQLPWLQVTLQQVFVSEKDLPIKKRKVCYRLVTETASVEDEDAKTEVEADSTNMHDKEDLQEDGRRRTKDISSLINLECSTPEIDSVEVHEIIGEMAPETTVVEPKVRCRSQRNRKSRYPTYAVNRLTKSKFERKRRPKSELANQNNWWEKMQMPEEGEPKQVENEKAKTETKTSWEEMVDDQSKPTIVLGLPASSGRSDQIRKGGRPRKLPIT